MVRLQFGQLRRTISKLFPARFLFHPSVSALRRGSCGARRLRSFCFASGTVPVLASPVPVPPEMQLLVLEAAPTRFQVPETDGQNRRKHMYLNRITLIGFLGGDAEK